MNEQETLDLVNDQWPKILAEFLSTTRTQEVTDAQGRPATRTSHASDPPEGYTPMSHRDPRPGPLPELVALADVATTANVQRHEHAFAYDGTDVPAFLKHMAHVVVVEARRLRAKGIALEAARASRGQVVLEIVNVL